MASKLSARWLLVLKILITGGLVAYLAGKLDLQQLGARLLSVDPFFYAGAVATLAFPIILTSLRWQLILRAQGIVIPLRSAISFDLVALFFNAFLPGSTGGDAARAYYAIKRFPDEKTRIISSVLFDRGVGLLVLLVFGYFALLGQSDLFSRVEGLKTFAIYLPVLVVGGIVSFIFLFFLPSSYLPSRLHRWIHTIIDEGIAGRLLRFLKEQREHPAILVAALLISIASYLFNFLSAYLVASAMGLPITYIDIIVILAVLYTIISVPISFGGHGLREIVLIGLFFALAIGSAESAVAFSLLLFCVQLIWSFTGGCWFLIWRGRGGAPGDNAAWLRNP